MVLNKRSDLDQLPVLVQKFGGTSVGDVDRISRVAQIIAKNAEKNKILVVVSAIGNTTDQLFEQISSISSPKTSREMSEYDVVISAGEQISIGILSLALQKLGLRARSYLGWQIPIETNGNYSEGRIKNICKKKLLKSISRGEIPIIAGFQGVCKKRIVTLGRGGSDTTAIAIAAALGGKCEIYTDVNGIYTSDPRIVARARKLRYLSYKEALEMAASGAHILHPRAAAIAMRYHIDTRILSSFENNDDNSGTTLILKEKDMETNGVTAIISNRNLAKITLKNLNIENQTHIIRKIIESLEKASINIDSVSHQGFVLSTKSDFSIIVNNEHIIRAENSLESMRGKFYDEIVIYRDIATISIIGIGIGSNLEVIHKSFSIMDDNKIKIFTFNTSETKLMMVISSEDREMAVRALHSGLNLDLLS